MGTGKMMVEFFSAPELEHRGQGAQLHGGGVLLEDERGSPRFAAASFSPIAWMTVARRSRSASA